MIPTWLIAAGYAAAKGIGNYLNSRPASGSGGGADRCYEDWLPNSTTMKWLAVPDSQAHRVTTSDTVHTFEHFIGLLDYAARREPHLYDGLLALARHLREVRDAFPRHTIFVVEVG